MQSDELHITIARLVPLYSAEFGMSFPKLNTPLFLLKYIMRLALPSTVFLLGLPKSKLTKDCSRAFSSLSKPQPNRGILVFLSLYLD